MLDLSFNLCLYDKNHIKLLLEVIKKHGINSPVYIVQHEFFFQVSFDSDYEQYELRNEFSSHFKDYEYTTDLSSGTEEILLSVDIVQSPNSSDNWGRTWNSDAIERCLYLVRARERLPPKAPSAKIWVLFDAELKEYKVNIVPGFIPNTDKKGFLVMDKEGEDAKIISELLSDRTDAFWEGYRLITPKIEADYEAFKIELKSKRRPKKAKQ